MLVVKLEMKGTSKKRHSQEPEGIFPENIPKRWINSVHYSGKKKHPITESGFPCVKSCVLVAFRDRNFWVTSLVKEQYSLEVEGSDETILQNVS